MKDRKDHPARPLLVPGPRSARLAALPDSGDALAADVVVKALRAPKIPPLQGD
jgi:hypothetical protein